MKMKTESISTFVLHIHSSLFAKERVLKDIFKDFHNIKTSEDHCNNLVKPEYFTQCFLC